MTYELFLLAALVVGLVAVAHARTKRRETKFWRRVSEFLDRLAE